MTVLTQDNRFCVIGLDGVPYSLLQKLISQRVMPSLNSLLHMSRMSLRRMRVSIPEISSVSWTSFATGSNPGVHGIYGFVDINPETYEYFYPDFRQCLAQPIWKKVEAQGGQSVIINQPFTYPARSLKGHLVSGFVAMDIERSVFPRNLMQTLERLGYEIDIDTSRCRNDKELMWKQ